MRDFLTFFVALLDNIKNLNFRKILKTKAFIGKRDVYYIVNTKI